MSIYTVKYWQGTRLLFKFKSGTHEELGRHRGREGKSECALCGAEFTCCGSVLPKAVLELFLWISFGSF